MQLRSYHHGIVGMLCCRGATSPDGWLGLVLSRGSPKAFRAEVVGAVIGSVGLPHATITNAATISTITAARVASGRR